MSPETQEQVNGAIQRAQDAAVDHQNDILTRSQQRLYDAEQDVIVLTREKQKLDASIITIKEQITKLTLLLAQDERNANDLQVSITANLSLIDSLRKAGVILP